MEKSSEFVVDFPTLWVACDWIEEHCRIPDGFRKGEPFQMYDWQLWCTANFYRVKPTATVGQLAPAFFYRRSQCVAPQKTGKGPWTAAICANEGVGPAVFDGWALGGEVYDCRDHGCGCGWLYEYEPGEPMAIPWPTPLVQITAFSEEQTDNVYRPLQSMIRNGPLGELMRVGEQFIRLPNDGRIDVVTSSAQSRLGNPVTFVLQDEALALDTPLPTPRGWTTMGDVVVGDFLIGADGLPVKVIKATEVQTDRQCYRVTFADGTSMVASDGHRWLTRVSSSAALPRVRTTGEMVADGRRFRIPAPMPYILPEADLPVHPYLLGLWLGDGTKGQQYITAHNDEVEELQRHLVDVGVRASIRWNRGRAAALGLSRKGGYQSSGRPEWAKALQSLACYRDKHIPDAYFRGSLEQRVALLQGLMDSDGHVTATGFCTFAGNDALSRDVLKLLRTLGHVGIRVRHVDQRSRTGEGWKVNFTPRGGLLPFRLKRKADRVRPAKAMCDWVTVTSIARIDTVPVRCVGVDSEDHLFLAGDAGHVTHNTQLWTPANKMDRVATTQRRGAAGMGGRTMETTNAWNPSENSVAQQTSEAKVKDIFRFHRVPPASLSYKNKADRRKIHRHVYMGSTHVDLDAIEAEAAELLEKDPEQAERFFGNRIVYGAGSWMNGDAWDALAEVREVPDGTPVVGAFDGSDVDDWTAIRLETLDGYQFTPSFGPDQLPTIWNPADYGGQVPRLEVAAAFDEVFARFHVVRFYADPPYWESEIDALADRYGEKVVVRWYTYRTVQMHAAAERLLTDVNKADSPFRHDGCVTTAVHVRNARKAARTGGRYVLGKASPAQKIDAAIPSILAHEAAGDAIAAGQAKPKKKSRMIVMR